MKKSKFFVKFFLFLFAIIVPLACGSDDNGAIVDPPFVDTEATYAVKTAKVVGDYAMGESLATVSDSDGNITTATLESGSNLPAGTALNGTSGELTVSDTASLVSGTYSFSVSTEDVKGGTTEHDLTITFNETPDEAAVYVVVDAKAVKDYTDGESIATVSDADGEITSAALESGFEVPAGTILNATTGEITVEDSTLLTPGTYNVEITTEDANGGTTQSALVITFSENPDVPAVYTVVDAKAVEDYTTDESIATVTDENGDITSAILGGGTTLPAGTELNGTTGQITVGDPTLLTPGTYTIEINTEDENAGATMHSVTLVFNENPFRLNINSGGDEVVFTDVTFSVDQSFVGTSLVFTPTTTPEIANTDKDIMYLTERYGTDFGYEIDLENGDYKVTLHFVELFWGAPGSPDPGPAGGVGDRVFDVSLEGVVVLDDYDIFAEVGALSAVEKEFNITLDDTKLNIGFISSVDNAKISAIEIEKVD